MDSENYRRGFAAGWEAGRFRLMEELASWGVDNRNASTPQLVLELLREWTRAKQARAKLPRPNVIDDVTDAYLRKQVGL